MKIKKQGYNARLDESLGRREGAEKHFKESLKERRNESKGMEKFYKAHHPYASVSTMDRGLKKHGRKK